MSGNNRILARITNFGTSSGQPDNISDIVVAYFCTGFVNGPITSEVTVQVDSTFPQSAFMLFIKNYLATYLDPLITPTQGYTQSDVLLDPAQIVYSINDGVTRPIDSTPFTISTIYAARFYYTISIQCTATIGGSADGKILFQYSIDAGANWISSGELENTNTVTLAIALNSSTKQTAVLCGEVPPNALCRLVPTTAGTTVITYIRGSEILY